MSMRLLTQLEHTSLSDTNAELMAQVHSAENGVLPAAVASSTEMFASIQSYLPAAVPSNTSVPILAALNSAAGLFLPFL